MQRTLHAVIRAGEQAGYVADCPIVNAVTQGETLDEVARNLREVVALALALEGENLEELGLGPSPVIVVTFELEPAVA